MAKRHDITRNLIRVWVHKYEERAFDDDAQAADLIQEYEARIAAERSPPLSLQVQQVLKRDPLSGHLFSFRGRPGDVLKLIWHDGQGACLFTKRLERGRPVAVAGRRRSDGLARPARALPPDAAQRSCRR